MAELFPGGPPPPLRRDPRADAIRLLMGEAESRLATHRALLQLGITDQEILAALDLDGRCPPGRGQDYEAHAAESGSGAAGPGV